MVYIFRLSNTGVTGYEKSNIEQGVRPVINLKTGVALTGSGTVSNPFKVVEAE